MPKRKMREEDAQDSQDEDDRRKKPRAVDEGSESQSPPLADASQTVDEHGDLGMIDEAEEDLSLEDNTSVAQLQSVSHTTQVCTKVTQERSSGADDISLSI